MASKVSVEQLRTVAAQCKGNAGALVESQEVNITNNFKKAYDESNFEGFNKLAEASEKNTVGIYAVLSETLIEVGKTLDEYADKTDALNKSVDF